MKRFENKVVLVTGAARGQGEVEARLFHAEGACVVLADVLDGDAARLADELGPNALAVHLDVSDPQQWAAAVEAALARFGRLDVLVNNAGILRWGRIEDMCLDEYMQVIQINQTGCWLGMKAVLPALKAAGGGAIVNISSAAGIMAIGGASAYTASKFAVRGMSKCAALEFGRYGIRVNSVHPGGIDTPMVHTPDRELNAAYQHQPIARIGTPQEVARLVAFLASDEAAYMCGSVVEITGAQAVC